jgi:hypothetical protein
MEVSTACADDLQCSTDWSLNRMRAGFTDEWAEWRFRCQWYQNAPVCPEWAVGSKPTHFASETPNIARKIYGNSSRRTATSIRYNDIIC